MIENFQLFLKLFELKDYSARHWAFDKAWVFNRTSAPDMTTELYFLAWPLNSRVFLIPYYNLSKAFTIKLLLFRFLPFQAFAFYKIAFALCRIVSIRLSSSRIVFFRPLSCWNYFLNCSAFTRVQGINAFLKSSDSSIKRAISTLTKENYWWSYKEWWKSIFRASILASISYCYGKVLVWII